MVTGLSYELATPGRIIVGEGRSAELPEIVASLGSRALVCTGAHPERHAELISAFSIPRARYAVPGEPTIETARAGVAIGREHGADVVLAIGGGSVLDTGKAIAALLGNGGDPLDYLEIVGRGLPITRPAVPMIAVPTTAGTGSEATANAVLSVPERGVKVSLRSQLALPRVAVIDPLLTLSCPRRVTAAAGLDAFTQCLEPFVSIKANPITDAFAREGLRRAATGLRAAYQNGEDRAARYDMAQCGLLGGLALANAKLGAVHGLAGAVGGMIDVPHGVACAALLAPVVTANVYALRARQPTSPALPKFAEVARLLTGRADATVHDAISWISETVSMLEIPGLGEFGMTADRVDEAAGKAASASSTQGNPITLNHEELRTALAAAL